MKIVWPMLRCEQNNSHNILNRLSVVLGIPWTYFCFTQAYVAMGLSEYRFLFNELEQQSRQLTKSTLISHVGTQ